MLLLKNSGWSCVMFIFSPLFAYVVVKSSASNMFIYMILVLGIVVSELRQNTQKFIETMEKYISQIEWSNEAKLIGCVAFTIGIILCFCA